MSDELAADVRRVIADGVDGAWIDRHRLLRRALARPLPPAPSPLVPPWSRPLRERSPPAVRIRQARSRGRRPARPARASLASRRPRLHREAEPLHRARAGSGPRRRAEVRTPRLACGVRRRRGVRALVRGARGMARRQARFHPLRVPRHVPVHDVGEGRNRGAGRAADQRRRVRGVEAEAPRELHRPSRPTTVRTVRATMRASSARLWRRR